MIKATLCVKQCHVYHPPGKITMNICGISKPFQGKLMVEICHCDISQILSDIHGIFMKFPGDFMGYPWDIHGISMGDPSRHPLRQEVQQLSRLSPHVHPLADQLTPGVRHGGTVEDDRSELLDNLLSKMKNSVIPCYSIV